MIYADKKFNYKKSSISVYLPNQCFSASNHPPTGGAIDKIVVYGWTINSNSNV
ncbi:MAG: hypothetical protein U9P79_04225 [Candidatus Cloacimonadota bacterium]|nr:hypothetical protein [Candidatus Cloacimonadota bacterium]